MDESALAQDREMELIGRDLEGQEVTGTRLANRSKEAIQMHLQSADIAAAHSIIAGDLLDR